MGDPGSVAARVAGPSFSRRRTNSGLSILSHRLQVLRCRQRSREGPQVDMKYNGMLHLQALWSHILMRQWQGTWQERL